jgi:hypothetical protein
MADLELVPILGPCCWRGPCAADQPISSTGALLPIALGGRAFSARIVEAHESISVQTFRSEFAIDGFDKSIVSRLASGREKSRITPR